MSEIALWVIFNVAIVAVLALDLVVFHREAHEVSRREALLWSVFWTLVAFAFNAGVFWRMGNDAGFEWATGYIIERSLSIDNVFLFLIVFASFNVPPAFQHRVLFWGVFGALVMRAALIVAGTALIDRFHWIIYFFGILLVVTGIRFLRSKHDMEAGENFMVRFARRHFRTTGSYVGQKFLVRQNGVLFMTPLMLVLIVIETTDLIFAVDSIPAILAITTDPFIVYTSNVFALLGMRALFFLLAGYLNDLPLLNPALAAILVFVGGKMLLSDVYHIPPLVSLAVVLGILAVAVVASIFMRSPLPTEEQEAVPVEGGPADPDPEESPAAG